MKLVNIDLIKPKKYDIKEQCQHKEKLVERSLLKHKTQFKPILVYETPDGGYQLIQGGTLLKKMKELGYKEIWILDIGMKTIAESLDICNTLDASVRDIDILKFAKFIIDSEIPDEKIADELGINVMQIRVYKDLLNLKFTYEENKDKSQKSLFDEEA